MRKDIRERIDRIKRGEVPEGYKKTKLGIIPEKWELESFSDIVVIEGGLVDPKIEPYASMYHIGSENIEKNTGRIRDVKRAVEQGLISGKYEFDENCIIYSKIRPKLNKVCIPNYKGICSADCYVIKVKEKILKKYLYNYMLSEYFYKQAQACSMRTKMPKINRKELGTFKIIIPEIEEQEKINTFLEMYDRIIDLLGEKLENVRKKKKWLVQNLLTGKKRLAGFSSNWEKINLIDFLVEVNHKSIINDEYPVLTSSRKGIFFQKDYFQKQVASKENIGYKIINRGEFTYRTMSDDGNYTFNIQNICEKGIISPAYSVFKTNEMIVIPQYVYYMMNNFPFKKNMKILQQGGTRQALKFTKLCSIDISIPQFEEQKAIAQVLATADREIELLKKQLEQIKREKKAMMQLLLTGIVRVDEK